jgi:hypothetical protein
MAAALECSAQSSSLGNGLQELIFTGNETEGRVISLNVVDVKFVNGQEHASAIADIDCKPIAVSM